MSHAELVAYMESRGGVFERMTGKGRWRYNFLGRHPVEIPPPMANFTTRQWGNVHDQARREIDQIFARAGERPSAFSIDPVPASENGAAAPAEPPAETPDPPPALAAEEDPMSDALVRRDTLGRVIVAHAAKTYQPCPVEGCTQRATGPHIGAHRKRGELASDTSVDRRRRSAGPKGTKVAPAKRRMGPAPTPVVGPTSKSVKDLQEQLYPHIESIRSFQERIREEQTALLERVEEYHTRIGEEMERLAELMRDALKITADQETTLRLVTRERDEAAEQLRVIETTLSSRPRAGLDGRPR